MEAIKDNRSIEKESEDLAVQHAIKRKLNSGVNVKTVIQSIQKLSLMVFTRSGRSSIEYYE
jgi:hypothetical protein